MRLYIYRKNLMNYQSDANPWLFDEVFQYIRENYEARPFYQCFRIDGEEKKEELDLFLREQESDFSQTLSEMIAWRKMTDPECYTRANVDRRTFSKMMSNKKYQPSKQMVLAFAIALRLSLTKTKKLLKSAGYALSHSYILDLIVEFFIVRKQYDIHTINDTLYEYNERLLGSKTQEN